MNRENSIDDQFSKLHPCFPVNTRIVIVGAGPSGLSTAYALVKLGYKNVTVLEKYHTVGGMCESVELDGRIYDLGGQVLAANSAPTIFHLAKEIGSEMEEMDSHKLALINSATGRYEDIKVADDYVSVMTLTLQLQDKAKSSGRVGVHAVSEYAAELAPTYLEAHGVENVPKSVAYGFTASGYGFVQDMPYAYVHEFTRTSMAGKIRRFKGGYTSLWKKISEMLPVEVHCNAEVLRVRRGSDGVSVDVRNCDGEEEVMEFDKIFVSGAFAFRDGRTYQSPELEFADPQTTVMDMGELEKKLFMKVQTIDYYTTVLKIKRFDHIPLGFYYFGEYMDDPATIGHPVAMQKFYADTDIFLFWSYGNSANITGPSVTELAVKTVESMGGEVEKTILQRRFKYFPHVASQDMKDGFYDELESKLQGARNTYYVGGLMAFELTERNSSYAMALVQKHFAESSSSPMFPYVKSLFPLQPDYSKRERDELSQRPGVEFPDLSCLDGYIKHWGNHELTQNKTVYTWINEEEAVVCRRTYKELDDNASCIAHKLLTSQKPAIEPGDRVLLVYVPGMDFIDAFFACLRARVLPVPVLPPDPMQRGGQALLKIENVAKSCNAVAILSTVGYHSAVRAGSVKNLISLAGKDGKGSGSWPKLPWLHTDSWIKNSKTLLASQVTFPSQPKPSDLCFLQFTSGSTGDAKGVMITHGGLIHNVKTMKRVYKSDSNTVLVSWLPQYHDMGLIGGFFTALVSGGSAILFSPMTFIRKPLLWLQIMSRHKATHSAGPNFAFELVVRRLEAEKVHNFDLSSMVFLMIAAEPVRQKTLKRFVELTRPFGLSQEAMAPGYGLAENCVFVSCAFGENKPIMIDWQGRVSCGYVRSDNADVDITIVDPESAEEVEEAGREGEIWISSPSAGIGYWGRNELSERTFRNELKNRLGRSYTRTGDLGRIIDTNLFITGRIKDLIIVAGRNIYSADVEKTVESSSDSLRPGCCAVIGVPEDVLSAKGVSFPDSADQIGLVVIAEVRDGKPVGSEVIEQIRARVAEEHGVTIASIKLIKPKTICKTTSGKIKRFECLKQFSDGTLSTIPDPIVPRRTLLRSFTTGTCKEGRTPRRELSNNLPISSPGISNKEIVEFLRALVAEQTGIHVSNISPMENLVAYGIDSIGVVRAAQKLSDFLGVPVGAVDIFTATCIADLASFSESLVMKAKPQDTNTAAYRPETEFDSAELHTEVSDFRQSGFWFLQLLAIVYVSALLMLPSYLSVSAFLSLLSSSRTWTAGSPWLDYALPMALAPLAWISCIVSTSISIAFFGNSFLRPNYALTPEISIQSTNFVKWWALCKAQEVSSSILAVHLRGTVFLNYWFEMLGARIGSSVLIDTIDITDPSLVWIGDGAVIAEGALIQSHEVRNGVLSFSPVRIGRNSSVGPYAVLQKGSFLAEEAELPSLQKADGGIPVMKSPKPYDAKKDTMLTTTNTQTNVIYQFFGIYMIGFLSSVSAGVMYFLYIWFSGNAPSTLHFTFLCTSGAFHWLPFAVVAYAAIFSSVPANPAVFSVFVGFAYLVHGMILSLLTSVFARLLTGKRGKEQPHLRACLRRQLTVACHLRFAKLLSGTEAFCVYLRLLGAEIGRHCSIRAINAVSEPRLISVGDGVHLGDFSSLIPGFYSSDGYVHGRIEVQSNSVVGSQSVVLPGSLIQENVMLGALSVAPTSSVLQSGGVYIGARSLVMIKNTMHALDDRIEEMDVKYKKIVGNLCANLAVTTLKVKSRYFHRIGVGGKGYLKIYDDVEGFPAHEFFSPGRRFPVVIRHSNSLSADDDARLDARGAALRLLADEATCEPPILDLTLKTGNAFYARTIADFATWLVCGLPAREEYVKRAPHVRDAVWASLRVADSYTELHYYSNICRLFRFADGKEMYVKFKLRPCDDSVREDAGRVEPVGILPPDTGAIPRDKNDTRPLLFLADDFQHRVSSPGGVRYVFQVQARPVPDTEPARDMALDCTKPWDEVLFPYIDLGEIVIDESLTREESEGLEFNPFLRRHEVDVVRATSSTESASIDHGRSLVYEICQRIRNAQPLPEAWRVFLDQSDVKVNLNLSGCPIASPTSQKPDPTVTLARTSYQTTWLTLAQPLLQTVLPYSLVGLVIFSPLHLMLRLRESRDIPLHYLLPFFYAASTILAALASAAAKWALVGRKKDRQTAPVWSAGVYADTTWQAFRTLVGDCFMGMASGSVWFVLWMRLMGAEVALDGGVYVDSAGAMMNPEMVRIGRGGSVGREALLFGHVYEGEGGRVKFGKVEVGEGGFVGSRAVAMPGVTVEEGGCLPALALAMKGEIVRAS